MTREEPNTSRGVQRSISFSKTFHHFQHGSSFRVLRSIVSRKNGAQRLALRTGRPAMRHDLAFASQKLSLSGRYCHTQIANFQKVSCSKTDKNSVIGVVMTWPVLSVPKSLDPPNKRTNSTNALLMHLQESSTCARLRGQQSAQWKPNSPDSPDSCLPCPALSTPERLEIRESKTNRKANRKKGKTFSLFLYVSAIPLCPPPRV